MGVELQGERTGVGRYLEALLAGAEAAGLGWQWRVFLHGGLAGRPRWRDPAIRPVVVGGRRRPVAWEQLELPAAVARSGLDLLFSPGYSLPLALPVPGVVTLHDLSFESRPSDFRFRERWRRRVLARLAARRAARVLADTGSIAAEVGRRYGVEGSRIGVVPVPFDAQRWRDAPAGRAELGTLGVEPPYLLFLGTLLGRRGLEAMLRAAAELRRRDPALRLVLAGRTGLADPDGLERKLAAAGLGDAVVRLGWVEEALLPALYAHAEATLYLSEYEGFGLPPLESLACGTPAVVAPGLALDELWPGYPYRVAATEPEEVAAAVERARAADRREVADAAAERLGVLAPAAVARRLAGELERAVRP